MDDKKWCTCIIKKIYRAWALTNGYSGRLVRSDLKLIIYRNQISSSIHVKCGLYSNHHLRSISSSSNYSIIISNYYYYIIQTVINLSYKIEKYYKCIKYSWCYVVDMARTNLTQEKSNLLDQATCHLP